MEKGILAGRDKRRIGEERHEIMPTIFLQWGPFVSLLLYEKKYFLVRMKDLVKLKERTPLHKRPRNC